MSTSAVRRRPAGWCGFDTDEGRVILAPESSLEGFWVGCPSVLYEPEPGRFLMTCRHRRPRGEEPERGWRCAILASEDGERFEEIWSVNKDALGSSSMERFCLVPSPAGDGYLLYMSYVDPKDHRWRIDVVAAATPERFDVTRRTAVLTAEETGTEGVKDPWVMSVGPAIYLFASFASADNLAAADRARAHEQEDIYNMGLTTHPTGLATSTDGLRFDWQGEVLGVGESWDRYQARVTSIVASDGAYVALYDGSASAAENYEERAGLAMSHDLRSWHRLTTSGPWLSSPHASGSLRYVEALPVGGELWFYYELAKLDGSHELRLSKMAMQADAQSWAAPGADVSSHKIAHGLAGQTTDDWPRTTDDWPQRPREPADPVQALVRCPSQDREVQQPG